MIEILKSFLEHPFEIIHVHTTENHEIFSLTVSRACRWEVHQGVIIAWISVEGPWTEPFDWADAVEAPCVERGFEPTGKDYIF